MERSNSTTSPPKKETETNVISTEMMDPKHVPESPIEVKQPDVEHKIPQEKIIGSDFENRNVSEGNDCKEIILDPPIDENVIIEKEPEEQLTFSVTAVNSEFQIRKTETDANRASDPTIVSEEVIETVNHEVLSVSQDESITNEFQNSDISQNTSQAQENISCLTVKDNLNIQTVVKKDEQEVFADTNVLPTYNEIDEETETSGNETVLYNPKGLIEEVYTPTSQQMDYVIASCGDSNPDNLKGKEFPDINSSDQKISDSSGHARDKEDLLCEVTTEDPETTLKQGVEEQEIVDSRIGENTEQQPPTESMLSSGQTATSKIIVTCVESDVPVTPGSEAVFVKPAGIIEEVLTSASQQMNFANETCDDANPSDIQKGVFSDMNLSDQNIYPSTADAKDKEDLLSDVTLVSNAIEDPEVTFTQDVNTQQIGESPIRENIAEISLAITPETMSSSSQTVTSEIMSTCVKSDVPTPTIEYDIPATTESDIPATTESDILATTESDIPATTEPDIPATTESDIPATTEPDIPATTESDIPATTQYLDDSLSNQKLPGTPMKPFIVSSQSGVISTEQPDILSGTARETTRRSLLRNFDPLLFNSPNQVTAPVLQDVLEDIQVVADSPTPKPVNELFKKTGILIDLSAIVIPDQEDPDNLIVNDEEPMILNGVIKLDYEGVEETKESVGTQTSSEHRKKKARYSDSRESLRVHCNDSSRSFNEEYFEAQSVLQRHIERSLKGFVDFGPREESDIEGRVFEIEPQVYEDESELSKTPVRKRSPTRKKAHKHDSSGEETREEQPTQPPKYLHVLEKQRRDIEEIQIITSDSETDIEIKKKKVLANDDIKTSKEVCEKVKHHDETFKKKKTPEKIKLIVAPHNISITEELGDKNTKKTVKDNKYTESEKSSYKETSESEHGKVRVTKKFVKKKGDPRVEIDTNKEEKLSEPQEEECALEEKYLRPFIQKLAATTPHFKMADLSEKLNEQQQENSELKLQLNASQQAKASLELEIRQKEEIIIKTQAEALKNEQIYKHELKQLKEKLKENSKLIEKDTTKELEEQLKEAKARELKAAAELAQKNNKDIDYQKMMNQYEITLKNKCAENQKLAEELNSVKTHLSNLELAFSDVHLKYEKTKESLQACKSNEETLLYQLSVTEQTNIQQEEKYESLMVHAKSQIERSNRDNLALTESYEGELSKLKAIIKRLEIKCSSLESTLQQKTAECEALAALCDEVTGKKV